MKYESRSRALGLAGKNEMAASIKSETRAQMAKVNPSAALSLTVLGKELSLDCPLCDCLLTDRVWRGGSGPRDQRQNDQMTRPDFSCAASRDGQTKNRIFRKTDAKKMAMERWNSLKSRR